MSRFLKIALSFVLLLSIQACTKSGGGKKTKGSTIYYRLNSEPGTLNPFGSTDLYASAIQALTIDGLATRNIDTYEWEPALAESWDVAKDGKSITFKLRKGATFHDGSPVTVEDVKFSFDAIKNPEYKAMVKMTYLDNIESAEVIDPQTIKFNIKKKYFGNFGVLAGGILGILPRSFYGDPKVKRNKEIMGSGPYKIHKYKRGKYIQLAKNKDWYGWDLESNKGMYNFDILHFRFVQDDNIALEMVKKGELDLYEGMNPEMYAKKAIGKPWGETAFTQKVQHKAPKPYRYVAFNQKNPIFQDRDVRMALTKLMDRRTMIKKFRYDLDLPATGPWYQQSPYANPSVKAVEYDPEGASALLKKAGWTDSDKDGILDKVVNGKRMQFKFSLINSNPLYEKYFTMYQEALKKAGIVMNYQVVDFTSLIKLLDDKKFDVVSLGWGGGSVDNDPKQIWHSESARKGGSNYISYSNKKVDALIDKGRAELDREKRIKIYQQIYKLIADDAPYVFMFNEKYQLYANSNNVEFDKPTRVYGIGDSYWRPAQ